MSSRRLGRSWTVRSSAKVAWIPRISSGGQHERGRVHDDRDVGPEHPRHDPAEGAADREHRAPQRPRERVRDGEVALVHQVRHRRHRGRLERGREHRRRGQQDVDEPREVLGPHQEEPEHQDRPGEVAGDHEPAPVEPVREHAGERRGREVREVLRRDRERHGDRLTGQVEHQPEQGDQQEPVPTQRDHRREVQPAEVPVAPEQGDGGPKAALRLDPVRALPRRFARLPADGPDRRRPSAWGSTGSRGSGRRRSGGRATVRWCTSIRGAITDDVPADVILITHAHSRPSPAARDRAPAHVLDDDRGSARRRRRADRRRHADRARRVRRGRRAQGPGGARLQHRRGAPGHAPEVERLGGVRVRVRRADLLPRR